MPPKRQTRKNISVTHSIHPPGVLQVADQKLVRRPIQLAMMYWVATPSPLAMNQTKSNIAAGSPAKK